MCGLNYVWLMRDHYTWKGKSRHTAWRGFCLLNKSSASFLSSSYISTICSISVKLNWSQSIGTEIYEKWNYDSTWYIFWLLMQKFQPNVIFLMIYGMFSLLHLFLFLLMLKYYFCACLVVVWMLETVSALVVFLVNSLLPSRRDFNKLCHIYMATAIWSRRKSSLSEWMNVSMSMSYSLWYLCVMWFVRCLCYMKIWRRASRRGDVLLQHSSK